MANDDNHIRSFPLKVVRKRPAVRRKAPKGKLEMVITYLEMTGRPHRPHSPHRGEKLALMRIERPVPSYYRYLYNTVGGPWLWYERRLMDDTALCDIVHHPKVEIYVLYVGGNPAGFVELDCRTNDEIEIVLFGLLPEFIGRGLGRYLLDWSVDEAWDKEPDRVWVHTCNLDHPHAIAVYQRAGFAPYRQETVVVDDPRLPGAMPPGQEFRD
jgi:GNAT superfamily N-acetyltransferase